MNWLTRLLISTWTLVLVPIVFFGVWLSGVWVGEDRTKRAWDDERHQVALAQAREEQKSAEIKRSQEQIDHEIAIEFNQRSVQLAADWQSDGSARVRCSTEASDGYVSAVSATPRSIAEAASDPIPATSRDAETVSCEQLSKDAAQTTLMFLEIQRWYELQIKNLQ